MQTDTSTELPASQQSPQTNPSQTGVLSPSLTATAPGQLKIIKRNGTVVPYTADKISVAMTKAFLAVEGGTAAASPRIRELVQELADQMTATFKRRMPSGGTLHIEETKSNWHSCALANRKWRDPMCCIASSALKSAANSKPSIPVQRRPLMASM
jgi:ribonucleoside-diphosphate reductase alpha chain